MSTQRTSHFQKVRVDPCPACGKKHEFDIQVILDELVDVFTLTRQGKTTEKDYLTNCPNTGGNITITVPVYIAGGSTFVGLK